MKKIFFTILTFLFFFSFIKVNASSIIFNSSSVNLIENEVFRVDMYLDTNEENINSIEVFIKFDDKKLELEKVYSGNSVIDFWVKSPRVQGDEIYFSGIIPGGYNGKANLISMLFVAKESGVVGLSLDSKSKFLLNDGFATEDNFSSSNLLLEISPKAEEDIKKIESENQIIDRSEARLVDETRPEEFIIKILKDKKTSGDKFIILFNAKDKDSGIAYYEVKEGDGDFIKADSPYVLKYQDLTKEIQVKAVDLEGNYRIEKLGPIIIKATNNTKKYKYIILSLLFALFVLIPIEIFQVKKRKQNVSKEI